jgi:hypothetical protein
MSLGLRAKITLRPGKVLGDRWTHDMANVLCRGKIRAEIEFLAAPRIC